uniref:Uncharacterized protein n=1 Tax=Brassica oleracea var. oleracea TaxID=109376 RepID=A0A0D3D4B1_BRAOL
SCSCVIGGGRGEEPKVKEEETFCEAQKPQDKGGYLIFVSEFESGSERSRDKLVKVLAGEYSEPNNYLPALYLSYVVRAIDTMTGMPWELPISVLVAVTLKESSRFFRLWAEQPPRPSQLPHI